MIKVAYLLGSLNHGGTETLLLDILNFNEKEYFKTIGVYRKEGTLSEGYSFLKTALYKLTPGPKWMFWLYLWRLRKILKTENVDIVHAQQSLDVVYARLACLGRNIKVIQTLHGYDLYSGYFNKLLIRLSLKMADKNIYVSEAQKRYFAFRYKINKHSKQTVVYNGINFEKLNSTNEISIRIELNLSEKNHVMAMVGNFVHVRDQLTICRFLNLLNKKGVGFMFLFIGKKDESNPQLYNDCLSFCENNSLMGKVLFLGSRSDVPAILPQLDAFIYSTDHDTFGIAVIEAIAAGIPVFVNDWEVMKEITEDGKRANLYRTKDEKDLLIKFLAFLVEPAPYKKTAHENAAWARNTYSIQNHLECLHEVYREII